MFVSYSMKLLLPITSLLFNAIWIYGIYINTHYTHANSIYSYIIIAGWISVLLWHCLSVFIIAFETSETRHKSNPIKFQLLFSLLGFLFVLTLSLFPVWVFPLSYLILFLWGIYYTFHLTVLKKLHQELSNSNK